MSYEAFAVSVIGESHIRKNIVCQDYSGYVDNDDVKIAVISDGHGDSACFRSNKGAEFAVKACIEGLSELSSRIKSGDVDFDSFAVEKRKEEFYYQLAKGITAKWNMMVIKDLEENPIEELSRNIQEGDSSELDDKTRLMYDEGTDLNHIYGATLVAVMVVDDFVIALQQGDGRCIFVDAEGDFSEPVPWDDRCYLNVTTSLCDKDAAQSFRFFIRDLSQSKPAALFVASDGIEDSYGSKVAMLCFYRILCKEITENGIAKETDYLMENRLSEISRCGSADDMSIAGIVDAEMLAPLIQKFERENELCSINEQIKDTEDRKLSMEDKKLYLDRLCDTATIELEELRKNYSGEEEFNEVFKTKLAELDKIINERKEYMDKYTLLSDKYNELVAAKARLEG